ncbi:VOC family protein [Gordonia liuliyuniae]|uniref:VOC family protein n=1 Tax=Gordonia liuliyuniae TaxID=2911517 RepID=A0ABS9IND5_9ACTN|nr:VOC family protein [Gordonia liuliyuniae]MCF8587073.1 VOC family protein [Gordonia liuliyuniae]
MEILTSRTLLTSTDPQALTAFYRDVLGLAIAREYPGGTVFHAGAGLIEIPAHMPAHDGTGDVLWLQVRDVAAARDDLVGADVPIVAEPETKPWGLIEMTVHDPDGRSLILVQIPADHPLRRDLR